MTEDRFRCICDPNDLFEPPNPTPVAVEGCPAHQARRGYQQFVRRMEPDEQRICGNEREPDGERCVGWLRFRPGYAQAKCTVCGGWEGRFAPADWEPLTEENA